LTVAGPRWYCRAGAHRRRTGGGPEFQAGLDNHAAEVDFVRMGVLSPKAGASGTIRLDEFRSQRETPIGP
jgi:hypothetical protein